MHHNQFWLALEIGRSTIISGNGVPAPEALSLLIGTKIYLRVNFGGDIDVHDACTLAQN